ncbi:MAG: hypothetical protein Q7S64_03170 [bacterium]|nr:hypothetical protein [bacterium]
MNAEHFLALVEGPAADKVVVEAWQQVNQLKGTDLTAISEAVAEHRPHLHCDLFESKL